jgi:hypothetical protein
MLAVNDRRVNFALAPELTPVALAMEAAVFVVASLLW